MIDVAGFDGEFPFVTLLDYFIAKIQPEFRFARAVILTMTREAFGGNDGADLRTEINGLGGLGFGVERNRRNENRPHESSEETLR